MNESDNNTYEDPVYKGRRYTAILGGTFDPVHLGHLCLAEKVLEKDLADEVMFIPAGRPPHKLAKPISSAEHRLNMLKFVINKRPEYSYTDYELNNKLKTSYTINTLHALQAAYPERRFKLIIGMDNFRDFDKWHRWQKILAEFELIIFARPGSRTLSANLIQEKFGAKLASRLADSIIDDVAENVSSTIIRDRVNRGEDISDLVLPEVANYIMEHGLYRA